MPGGGLLPKSPPPADHVYAVNLVPLLHLTDQNQEIISLMTLAGLVNRSRPAIFLSSDGEDPWLDWLVQRGDIDGYEWVSNPYELFARYGSRTNGLVVIDPAVSATYNVACVVSACEGLIACHPGYVSSIRRADPSLTVVRDLRQEHFAHNGEAYEWAYDRYWPGMRHDVLAWIDTSWKPFGPRDYCVAHKIFPLWVNNYAVPWEPGLDVEAERAFAEKVLAGTPENIPILGWPGLSRGLGEREGIGLWSRYAKYGIVADNAPNLSFQTGCAPVAMAEYPPSPKELDFDIDKIYVAVYHSEGEVLWENEAAFRRPWRDANRGQVPYGWSLGLLQQELIPAVLDWYIQGDGSTPPIQPRDELISAMSGLGYIFPNHYPDRALEGFLDLTGAYMRSSGMRTLAVHFWKAKYAEKKEIMASYGAGLAGTVDGMFCEYTYNPGMSYGQTNYLSNGVPTFHALAPCFRNATGSPEQIALEFHQRLHQRQPPAFGEIFLDGWASSPGKALRIKDALDELDPDRYVLVRPDELGILYKESGGGIEPAWVDDFSEGDGGWTVESGRWLIGGGGYVQTDVSTEWHLARAGNCQWDNVAVSVRMRAANLADRAGVAVFGRYRGRNNAYYRLDLWRDSEGASVRLWKKQKDSAPRLLAESAYPWQAGQDMLLGLIIHCNTITCTIGGEEVLRVIDPEPIPRGWMAVGSYGNRTTVEAVRVERSVSCVDCDGDGFGEPGDAACEGGPSWDCDDNDPGETPGGREGPSGSMSCEDGLDNDCDGLFDRDDPDCD